MKSQVSHRLGLSNHYNQQRIVSRVQEELLQIIKEKWANGVGGEFTGHKVWQMNYFKEHTTDQAVFEGKISKSRLLSLVILLSFQTCMIVCIETPSVLISNCEDILVINIISWNFVGPVLSGVWKWFSGWNEIRRHWPPSSICVLCAFCSWGKK